MVLSILVEKIDYGKLYVTNGGNKKRECGKQGGSQGFMSEEKIFPIDFY